MFEYQITVHVPGKVTFRTEWIPARGAAHDVALALYDAFGAHAVTVQRRDAIKTTARGIDAIEDFFAEAA